MRVLLVEDEDAVAAALVPLLHRRGFTVDRLPGGAGVLDRLTGVDVVLLDLLLPDIDGVALCRQIRAVSDVAIIVVSGLNRVSDRILALHAGADDYLVKGYDLGELVARMHAVRRRSVGGRGPVGGATGVIEARDVRIDLGEREVTVEGEPVALGRREFDLLAVVAEARGALLTRERLLAEVWGDPAADLYDDLEQLVRGIRVRLGRPWIVETVRDVGYRLGNPTRS